MKFKRAKAIITKTQLEKVKKCINENNVYAVLNLVKEINDKRILKILEDMIVKSYNAHAIVEFARTNKNVLNTQKLEDAIIKTNDFNMILWFVCFIPGVDINKFENAVIKTNNPRHIARFAMWIPGANIENLENALVKTNDYDLISWFAAYINGANVKKLEDVIIKSNNINYIFDFAKNVYGANSKRLEKAFVKTIEKNIKKLKTQTNSMNSIPSNKEMAITIYTFARDVRTADINLLEQTIVKTGDEYYINCFKSDEEILYKKSLLKDKKASKKRNRFPY